MPFPVDTNVLVDVSVLPDFFIGGHAEVAAMPLLTRDTKRLRAYFPGVELICPILKQIASVVPPSQ